MKGIEHRLLVAESIAQLGNKSNALSGLFYTHLFQLKPDMAHIFSGGVPMLNRKFSSTLATFKSIQDLETIRAALETMAERHVNYRAEVEYFPVFKEALLLAWADFLGDAFTSELGAAWEKTFDEVAAIMVEVLEKHPKPSLANHEEVSPEINLLKDIGGKDVIWAVHTRFYDDIYEDDFIGAFFHFRAKRLLISKQTDFMIAAFGGENNYRGEPPAFVHMHMFITKEMSDVRTVYLRRAILAEGLSESICERWLSVDASFHASLEKRSEGECVMRVWGQHPMSVKKPAAYVPPGS